MVLAIILTALCIGALCVLLFNLAIYALPVFVAFTVGYWAIDIGAGAIGAFAVGIIAGTIVFTVGHAAIASSQSLRARCVIAMLFTIPAAYMGYSAVLGLAKLGTPSYAWQHLAALLAAIVTSHEMFARLATPPLVPDRR
jgi:hypothetical protein